MNTINTSGMTSVDDLRPSLPGYTKFAPVVPSSGAQFGVRSSDVTITSGFWQARQSLNTERLLDHADSWIESMGWYDAFSAAAGGTRTIPMRGKLFTDADVYKLLEAFAWEIAARPDDKRSARLATLSRLVGNAQEEDGYLNTYFGPLGKDARYADLAHGHELYCAGHLFQAAVARMRSGVDDELTGAAIRLADRICEDFGPEGRLGSDGHPEVEVGLMELYRATDNTAYLQQARRFIDQRGRRTFEYHAIGDEYYIDDMPIRDASVFRGHVVRAMYLAAAAVDLAVETDDRDLLEAIVTQWDSTWAKRTYITGGMGSRHLGESFGDDFDLPPDRAYAETCGAVGAIMVAWRLLLATGKSRFADAIERLLYNMIATHPNEAGDRFFYVNPLLRREPGIAVADGVAPFRKDTLRANWFWVACCPTNVARLLSSLGAYFATVGAESLTIQQYFTGSVRTLLGDGRTVGVSIETEYPWDSTVRIQATETVGRWTLRLRIPEWSPSAALTVNGETIETGLGYAEVTRDWAAGDVVILTIPLDVRVSRPDPRINALRDTLAIERGPLVFCAESLLSEGEVDLDHFFVAADPTITEEMGDGPSDAAVLLRLHGRSRGGIGSGPWPYRSSDAAAGTPTKPAIATLIPYYAWSNRGPSTMRVWIPTESPKESLERMEDR